jgi:hypothetical protein
MEYQIKVKGKLDKSWSDWLGGASVAYEFDENGVMITTLKVQATDQPALFGILDRIRDMNLLPISVELVDGQVSLTTQEGYDEILRNKKRSDPI